MKKHQSFNESSRKSHGFECTDCGEPTQDFYVKNNLWNEVMPSYKRNKVICIPCFEERLGRKLKKSDFMIGWERDWRERPGWDENYWNSLEEKIEHTDVDPYGEENWGEEPKWKLMKNIKHGYYKIFQEDNKGVYYEYYFWNNYPHVYEGDIKEFKEITSKQAKELLGDLYGIKQEEEVPTGKVSTWYSLSRIKIPEIKRDLTEFLENKIKEQNESVRWYHKGKLNPAEPSKEKERKLHEYELITYRGGSTYIVEKYINDNDMILFNNFHYHLPRGPHDNIISDVFYPIEDEMKKRIFDDRIRISIYNNDLKKWEEMI